MILASIYDFFKINTCSHEILLALLKINKLGCITYAKIISNENVWRMMSTTTQKMVNRGQTFLANHQMVLKIGKVSTIY